jgi:hypothetical protein
MDIDNTNIEVNIDTTMLDLPKGSRTLRIRAEFEETLNANYLDYTQIYTAGSKMEEIVECAVVAPDENKEIRLPKTFFNLFFFFLKVSLILDGPLAEAI